MIKSTKKSAANTAAEADRNFATPSDIAFDSNPENKPRTKRSSKSKAETKTVTVPAAERVHSEIPSNVNALRTTKQDLVLTLLHVDGGTTINEVMRATGWQEHSVRGFFAGTVRKKLGFDLISAKQEGSDRRYAIKVAA